MKKNYSIRTGDHRLDELIDKSKKGFNFSSEDPLRIIVKGLPGTGKSTLISQMALQFMHGYDAKNDTTQGVLYYSLDEDANTIRNRIEKLSENIGKIFTQSRLSTVSEKEGMESALKSDTISGLKKAGGIIIRTILFPFSDIVELRKDTLEEKKYLSPFEIGHFVSWERICVLVDTIKKDVKSIRNKVNWKPVLILIDSINSILESSTEAVLRTTIRLIMEGIERQIDDCCLIFVAEAGGQGLTEDYLADVVIITESDINTGSRFLSVVKARDHKIKPIKHTMLIDSDGVRIIPKEIYENWKSPNTGYINPFNEKMIDNLFQFLPNRNGKTKELNGINTLKGIPCGSSMLIVGPPGTRKNILSLQYLKGGLLENTEQQIRFISLTSYEANFVNIFTKFLGLSNKQCEEKSILCSTQTCLLLEEYEDKIIKFATELLPLPKRIVIRDIAELLLRFDEKDVFNMFYRLKFLLAAHQIDSIFTMTENQAIGATIHYGGIFNTLFENVLATKIIGEHGIQSKATALCITKFRGFRLQPQFLEYFFDPIENKLKIGDEYLSDMLEMPDGKLILGELKINHFGGDTLELRQFVESQKQRITEHFSGDPLEKPQFITYSDDERNIKQNTSELILKRETILQSLMYYPSYARHNRSEILMFDQPWVPQLRDKLIPLNTFLNADEKKEFNDLPENIKQSFSTKDGRQILGLPYFHNFLCLFYRSDLIKKTNQLKNLENYIDFSTGIINPKSTLTWNHVFEIASNVAYYHNHAKKKVDEIIPFIFDDFASECFSSLLLSLSGNLSEKPKFSKRIKTIYSWLECAYKYKAVPISTMSEDEIERASCNSVFSIRWFTHTLKIKRQKGLENLHCLDTHLFIPLLGSWGLGILDGSLNPQRAIDTIRMLRSGDSQRDLRRGYIAIPANPKKWIDVEWLTEEEKNILIKAKCRTIIENYYANSGYIADSMEYLLSSLRNSFDKGAEGRKLKIIKREKVKNRLKRLDEQLSFN